MVAARGAESTAENALAAKKAERAAK